MPRIKGIEIQHRSAYGWHYSSVVTLRAGDLVSPLATRNARIGVADLLP